MTGTVLYSLLYAVSANIDSVVAGLSLGLKNIKLSFHINIIIGCIISAVTALSVAAGGFLQRLMPDALSGTIGGGLLVLIGLYSLYKDFFSGKNKRRKRINVFNSPDTADKDKSGYIDAKESIVLAAVLSLNNLGIGIGAGVAGLNVYITAAFSFVFSIAFLSAGCLLGRRLAIKALGKYASCAASMLIILLGICEIVF